MRANIVGLLAVALVCVCGVARSNIVYDVNISNGTETISGTITTDGNTGPLVPGDIIAWNLMAVGPDQVPPGGVSCGLGCGISATLSDLEFTSTSLLNDTILQTAD